MLSHLFSLMKKWRSSTGQLAKPVVGKAADVAGSFVSPSRAAVPTAGPPDRSPTAHSSLMTTLWAQYETWLSANVPDGLRGLNPGASFQQMSDLQEELGVQLPQSFLTWEGVHNGQTDDAVGLLDGSGLLSNEAMLAQWMAMNALLDKGQLQGVGEADPPEAIAPVWWSKGWIPIAADGSGNLLCIDMAPGPTGTVGQIIDFDHETVHRTVLASSFEAYARDFVAEVLAGRYGYSDDYGRLMPLNEF